MNKQFFIIVPLLLGLLGETQGEEIKASFYYGSAFNSEKPNSVYVRFKKEFCYNLPERMDFIFNDGTNTAGKIEKTSIYVTDKAGNLKKYSKNIQATFLIDQCSSRYILEKPNTAQAVMGVLNAKEIKVDKINNWKDVPYSSLDINLLKSGKPQVELSKQMNMREPGFCEASWSVQNDRLLFGYEEKHHQKNGVHYGAPVFDFQKQCTAKSADHFLHISCLFYVNDKDKDELHLTYYKDLCISGSTSNGSDRYRPGIIAKVLVDGSLFYILKVGAGDIIRIDDSFLIDMEKIKILENNFTPVPPEETI